ncbi:MAG TPA: bifunctional diaminohydroxyphosphoribosylaminopyrimidine deaminase/5-amino-6-(5-phosphoribosylamino)uracil reductase RibD, partial [Thermoanaerobaculia bacterium]
MPSSAEIAHLRRALQLAAHGRYRTSPNPRVGAVLVRDGEVVGSGWHRQVGGPHAEVEALREAGDLGDRARGATLFVTLEPCSHHGRTPPCADAVIAGG